jgi:DNA ligase-1
LHDSSRLADEQSQNKKVGIIKKLLAACQGNEAKFIVRSLEGKLRIGLADKTLVVALAHAIVLRDMGKLRALPVVIALNLYRGQEDTA